MDSSLPGHFVHGILQAGIMDLTDPGIKPGSLALQADFHHLSHQRFAFKKIKQLCI